MTSELIGAVALLLASPAAQRAEAPVAAASSCSVDAGAVGAAITAAGSADAAPMLPLGQRGRVSLRDVAAVRFALPPGHAHQQAPAAGTRGGLLALMVDGPGRYRIGLGGPAWIDVVRGTTALPSVAHAHGDACSPLKKLVDFDLVPGRYLVQLSGSAAPDLWVAVTRQP